MPRSSSIFLGFVAVGALLISLMLLDATFLRGMDRPAMLERREIVRILTITDLCLSTEARYTRHPSVSDLHTPFQDHPMSLEHYPSGSLIGVPPHLFSRQNQGQ